MGPSNHTPPQTLCPTLNPHRRVLLLFILAIALVSLGYPLIRAEHARLEKIRAARDFKTQLMARLSSDPQFLGVCVDINTGGDTRVIGEVNSPQAYSQLKLLIRSCTRKLEVHLEVCYPHQPPDIDQTLVFSDHETIPPGD